MTENKQILINYVFESGDNEISGQILIPFDGENFFKPSKITVCSGYLDDRFKKNDGSSSAKNREKKSKLISSNCEKEKPGIYKIVKPFEFINKGLVGFMGVINGYNSTREGVLLFDMPGHMLNGKKIAKVFQNLPVHKDAKVASSFMIERIELLSKSLLERIIDFEKVNLDIRKVMEVENE